MNIKDRTEPPTLETLARLTSRADATFVAAVHGRGRDGHGLPLPDLGRNIRRALVDLVEAGEIAKAVLGPVVVNARGGVLILAEGSEPPTGRVEAALGIPEGGVRGAVRNFLPIETKPRV